MHDLGDPPQHRVVDVVPPQQGLEGAVTAVVTKLHTAHVERGGVGRHLGLVGDEDELGVGVEEPGDQPG